MAKLAMKSGVCPLFIAGFFSYNEERKNKTGSELTHPE